MKVYEEVLFGNWDYVDAARASSTGTVTYYWVKVSSATEVDGVARQIDALTVNSSHQTKSQGENVWATAAFEQFGDVGLIATSIMVAVFFTLLLLTGHTMTQAVHERISELAVLKTIGFTGLQVMGLVLSESILLLLFGSVVGLTLATIAATVIRSMPSATFPLPILAVGFIVWLRGLLLAVGIALVVGTLAGRRGLRLRIVDALSGHEK
jgi:putative ABC transport system permease protein